MLSQETDFMCASFISGCAVSYATLSLFNHFRLSHDERRKIGMLNCLLDRIKLELEIRDFDAKLLRNKELENDTQNELCAVRIEIGKLEDVKDKVIKNLEDNMDVDDMQNQEPVEDMMDIDDQEHMLPEEPMDDPMEEIGLDSDEDEEDEEDEKDEDEEEMRRTMRRTMRMRRTRTMRRTMRMRIQMRMMIQIRRKKSLLCGLLTFVFEIIS